MESLIFDKLAFYIKLSLIIDLYIVKEYREKSIRTYLNVFLINLNLSIFSLELYIIFHLSFPNKDKYISLQGSS